MNFRRAKLSEIADVQVGFAFPSKDFVDSHQDGVLLLRGDNLQQGYIRWGDKAKKWPFTEDKKISRYLLKETDVVLAMDRPIVAGGLKISKILPADLPCYLVQRVMRLRGVSDIDTEYIFHLLRSKDFIGYIERITTGANIPHISHKEVVEYEFDLPSPEVKAKIASILSNYDDLIQVNQQRITLLEEAAQRLYDEWFVKLRFPNHEQVPVVDGVPEGWERGTVYDFADILSGGTPKTTNTEFWDGDIPFFTPKDSPSSFFTFSCEKTITQAGLKSCNSPLYPENSLFITARGTVGKICLAGVPMAMNQSCYSIKPKQNFSPYYFYLALQRSIAQIKQTANGGVFDAIIVDTFRSIDMLRPNLHLAESFSVMIEPFFGQMKSLIIQNQKLMQARDDLLPRLMSGRLDVSTLSAVGEE